MANGNNTLTLADSVLHVGEGAQWLYVEMQNPDLQATALQFDLFLPEGLTFQGAELLDRDARTSDHKLLVGPDVTEIFGAQPTLSGQSQRIVLYSPTNAVCQGTSGAILRVSVTVAETMLPGQYPVQLSGVEMVAPANAYRQSDPVTAQVTVAEATGVHLLDAESGVGEASVVYDLSGRRLLPAHRGLHIEGGKKILKK